MGAFIVRVPFCAHTLLLPTCLIDSFSLLLGWSLWVTLAAPCSGLGAIQKRPTEAFQSSGT